MKMQTEATALCKFWCNSQCSKGNDCAFRHAYLDAEEEARVMEQRRHREELKRQQHDPCDPFEDKLPRSTRAMVFGEWIVRTFGAERLRQGSGVVDVAGGKGYLSFQLQCTDHNIPATLLEPRHAKLHRKQKKQLRKHKRHAFKQVCAWFEPKLWEDGIPAAGGDEALEEEAPEDCASGTSSSAESSSTTATASTSDIVVARVGLGEARNILTNCSAVFGLHSDQATEPIVDFALALNKAFAVVPCCVFPSLFPDRRLKNGQPVITPEQFVQYLMEKDPRIRLDYLAMEGRNKVVYMIPETTLSS